VLLATDGTPSRAAGIVAALTRGLGAARGALIGRMDADDVSLPGRFAAERELLARDPSVAAVGVQVEAFPAPAPGMQAYVAWQNALVSREDHARAVFVEAPLCHPSTLLRRAALDAVGGYRDVAWAEDYDLWLRLDAAGFGLAKVPQVLFRWRVRGDGLTFTAPRNARAQLLAARAAFLARRLEELARPFAIWGAGQTGRRLARALEAHGARPSSFLDIDPKKIGRTARGVPILDAAEGIASAARGELLLVVAVGDRGARDVVRARLAAAQLVEGEGFVCAA
jgi:GT2 family glycosyltransferase